MTRPFSLMTLVALLTQPVPAPTPAPGSEDAALGGPATVWDSGRDAFGFPFPALDRVQRRAFAVGNAFFKENWVTAPSSTEGRDGLGPLFIARSCSTCHFMDGRGQPQPDPAQESAGLLLRIGVLDGAVARPHPVYGGQLQDRSIPGVEAEGRIRIDLARIEGHFADGTPYELQQPSYAIEAAAYGPIGDGVRLSARVAPQLIGLGLLEAIAEETILARADPEDRDGDGISGRPNFVLGDGAVVVAPVRVGTYLNDRPVLGRFGWKASQPSIGQQVAKAFQEDLGITSSLRPQEVLTAPERASITYVSGGDPELDDHKLQRITFYCQVLAVPAQRNPASDQVRRGERLFADIGCARCHVPAVTTGDFPAVPALSHVRIRPYTDLLLHDMGPGLADGLPDAGATGSEWRTPPLWGIGLFATVNQHTRYLHDGRARDLAEAILWHAGEAMQARSAFVHLPAADRAALIAFLNSL